MEKPNDFRLQYASIGFDHDCAKAPLKTACAGGIKKACSELFKINQ